MKQAQKITPGLVVNTLLRSVQTKSAQECEGICSKFFITCFELKLRHRVRIYINVSFVVSQVELKFRVGDIIYVYGDMDDDGFFTVSEITLPWESKLWEKYVLR